MCSSDLIRQSHAFGRPVTVCGEAASNPRAILALYALGADALSVPPDDLPKARRLFQSVELPADLEQVRRLLLKACHHVPRSAQAFPAPSNRHDTGYPWNRRNRQTIGRCSGDARRIPVLPRSSHFRGVTTRPIAVVFACLGLAATGIRTGLAENPPVQAT